MEGENLFEPDQTNVDTREKLIPAKSKESYDKEFKTFEDWRKNRKIKGYNEDILLAYFHNYRKTLAPSSMWTKYSMLRSTLKVFRNVDISKYGKLNSYLKVESKFYRPKKAKMLERHHIDSFLEDAPDAEYLMTKVYSIVYSPTDIIMFTTNIKFFLTGSVNNRSFRLVSV